MKFVVDFADSTFRSDNIDLNGLFSCYFSLTSATIGDLSREGISLIL